MLNVNTRIRVTSHKNWLRFFDLSSSRLCIINMAPKGASTKLKPMRLPPLPRLKIRRPNQADANPCLAIMSSVLSTILTSPLSNRSSWLILVACWASSGHSIAGCQALETQLRACMDAPVGFPHDQSLHPSRIEKQKMMRAVRDSARKMHLTFYTETKSPEEEYD